MGADRLSTNLKYQQYYACTAVPAVRIVFRGNSCFDPGFTSGSQQPTGFGAYSNLYAAYRVIWSKIKVVYLGAVGSTNPIGVTVFPSSSSNPYTAGGAVEGTARYAKTTTIGQTGNATMAKPLSSYMTTRKIFGDRSDDDITYSALVNTNPSNSWYWVVDVWNIVGSNMLVTDYIQIEIVYGVDMEQPVSTVA